MVKLEVGKSYIDGQAAIFGPMAIYEKNPAYRTDGSGLWYENGDPVNKGSKWSPKLIAEWTEPPAEVIGENVRVVPINEAPDEVFERMAETRSKPYENDPVSQPPHYRAHPSGIECIQITEHMGFNLGNAIKYIWRCDLKQDAVEDLKKASWYIQREIEKREKQ